MRLLLFFLLFPSFIISVSGQQLSNAVPDGTEGELLYLNNKDTNRVLKRQHRTEFDLGFTTVKPGVGLLYDFAGYTQDDASKRQVDTLKHDFKVRDFRVIFSGKLNMKREVTWKMGIMYDGVSKSWLIRETGIMVKVPEISGRIFIGRTKEGYSMSKVMNGFSIFHIERAMAIDIIPILGDGIKYLGFLPKQKILWNAGIYVDWLSYKFSFSTYKWQADARVAYLPIYTDAMKPVFHIGVNYRYGEVAGHELRVRSRPEANPAPYFLDTKPFAVNSSNHIGAEIYYRAGAFLAGGEYNFHFMNSSSTDYPMFKGGEVFVVYTFTGETRPYLAETGIFTFLKVKNSVFKGGAGAWEGLLRFSTLDLNSGTLQGGTFWRITPMLNWYPSNTFRLTLGYGYGVLDRFGEKGATQFFQSRLMILL